MKGPSNTMQPTRAPYGAWKSPISADAIVADSVRLGTIAIDGDTIYWSEGRPQESGRTVVVRAKADGGVEDLTPAPFDVRSRVHEYGGAAFAVHSGLLYFINARDQGIYRQLPGAAPVLLHAVAGVRYAEPVVDATRNRLILVREDHRLPGGEAINSLVAIALGAPHAETLLCSGDDFYASPSLSADGQRIAWLSWQHPQMPWEGTRLSVAQFDDEGQLGKVREIAGGIAESIFQPQWSPQGELVFISDRSGYWNLYRWRPPTTPGAAANCGVAMASGKPAGVGVDVDVDVDVGVDVEIDDATKAAINATQPIASDSETFAVEPLLPLDEEFGRPQWQFGMSTFGFEPSGAIVCTYGRPGDSKLARLTGSALPQLLATPYRDIDQLRVGEGYAVFLGGAPGIPRSVIRVALADARQQCLRASSTLSIDPRYLSEPQAIEFPTEDGVHAHAFYYAARNTEFCAPAGAAPPLLVLSHGGPTAASDTTFNPSIQFWTSRGIAVVDVNYGGSSGYGRAYRQRLSRRWGIVDVDDAVNAARHLVALGWADAQRLAIRGGSAGGYTTLSALTFRDTFKAGASYYGIGDLEVLARDTHKFESRYLDSLVGPYPEQQSLYRERSPIHFVERLSSPMILFQGLEDKVVPPNQAQMMFDAVRAKGLPVAYLSFAHEQHGFRAAATIKRCLEAELYFYGKVFGFTPADALAPLQIENLPST